MDVEIWIPSEISRISPLVDRLIQMIELANCVPGEEVDVELALREAVSNAVIHGNQMDARKRVYVRCRCEPEEGVSFVVRDQGRGFDPRENPDATCGDGIMSEHGRGILLMKFYMDEVSFEKGGTEVHMWKQAARKQRTVLRCNDHTIHRDSANCTARAVAVVGRQASPCGWEKR
jgi:serine/threonine-protein kinase RsbW